MPSELAALDVDIAAACTESFAAAAPLTAAARLRDVARRLHGRGWTLVYGTGHKRRSLDRALCRFRRDGVEVICTVDAAYLAEQIRAVRKRTVCPRCGQVKP